MPLRLPQPPDSVKTRVLSVGPIPPEWGGKLRGGVTRFHAALIGEWKRRPWRHRMEPVGVLIPPPQRLKRWKAKRKAPVEVLMQPEEARPRRFTGLLLEKTQPDVVLVNNVAAFAPARYTRVHQHVAPEIPLVGIVHAWHQVTMKRDEETAAKNRAAAQESIDRLEALVFGSRHCRDEGIELGFTYPERVEVIPYPLQDAYTEDFAIDGPRSGVLFLGSLNERKNPIALLEAMAAIGSETVTFAGEGDEEERLRERAAELGIADRVEFVGHQDPKVHTERMRDLVRSSRVLCLPSFSESFGIVMIEALAAGTPVVGFGPTFTEIRERTGIDIGEPVFEGTPEEVGAGLEKVLAREWSPKGLRRRALANYSVGPIAREYARVVRQVARH
jgi:glycosyltransferase involved in cell wall biosynthesis